MYRQVKNVFLRESEIVCIFHQTPFEDPIVWVGDTDHMTIALGGPLNNFEELDI